MAVTTVARCESLTLLDYRCDARLHEPLVVERHGGFDLAYVREGAFGYHARGASTPTRTSKSTSTAPPVPSV
jgi:AraC family transcriptional regulator